MSGGFSLNLADVALPTPDLGTSAGSVGKLYCVENGKLNASNLRQKGSASDQIQLDVSDSRRAEVIALFLSGVLLLHLIEFRQ